MFKNIVNSLSANLGYTPN